jgi:serine protease Do
MRARFLTLSLFCSVLVAQPNFARAQDHPVATAEAVQEAFVRVAEKLRPSVVTIVCETSAKAPAPPAKLGDKTAPPPPGDDDEDDDPFSFSDPNEPRSSLGTGFVVRTEGYILTNYHVVKNADSIYVLFNSDSENPDRPLAKLVGFDEESDLAVLKVARTGLTAAPFADSDSVRIGQWALAMGAPFDQPQTFTAGVISAKGRHLDKKGTQGLQDYLQTDASINPGNSGGPLVNLDGQVIGINTAILSPSRFNVGIGFSVPSNTAQRLLPILLTGKTVQRGFLGIQYARLDDEVAKEFGVPGGMQIGALAKNEEGAYIGPAKEAGLREDDIITAVDGTLITSSDQFRAIVAASPPGKTLKFAVTRPGGEKATQFEASVTLGDRTALTKPAAVKPAVATKIDILGLGVEVANADKVPAMDKQKYGITGKEKGAVILKVMPGTPADEGHLLRGLRIVRARINGAWSVIPDAATWQKLEKSAAPGDKILLQLRDRDEISVYKLIVVPKVIAAPTATVIG